jgi:hypothetical protein
MKSYTIFFHSRILVFEHQFPKNLKLNLFLERKITFFPNKILRRYFIHTHT